MAGRKEKERELKQATPDPYEKIMADNQRKMESKLLEGKRSEMEQAIEDLGRKAIESEMKYGADHFNTKILTMFYNVTFTMKEFVGMMFAMKEAMSVLSQTMNIMDDVFDFINEMMKIDNYSSYSVMGRMKLQRRIRKFVKHNSNRMKAMFKMVSGYGKIADGMMMAMGSFDKKLKKSMSSGNGKKKDSVVAGYESEAQKQLAKMRSEMTAENSDSEGAGSGSTASAPSGGNAGAGSSASSSGDINIDDIV
ncbi:MAG: hypothetical protein K2M75_01835 [Clostridia bacterium]|nr:hypothetical protein [Clostridia bacterium]